MLDKVWWTHIIKAHKFEEDIVKAAAEGKSVLLSLPENVPWKNTLLDMVEEQLKQENYKNAFEYVDCPKEEPGLFLLVTVIPAANISVPIWLNLFPPSAGMT